MAHVCEKHNLKMLTYGTLVRLLHQPITPVSHCGPHSSPQLQCGGFLADKWLGAAEPDPYSGNLTPSQRKVRTHLSTLRPPPWFRFYLLTPSYMPLTFPLTHHLVDVQYLDMIVRAWGTWDLFQSLLLVLRSIADRHGKTIANIATRWVLDHPFVGAVLIGAYILGSATRA